MTMAKRKTSPFTLTDRVELTSTANQQTTIDIGALIDIVSSQGLSIYAVDFNFQREVATGDYDEDLEALEGAGNSWTVGVQLTDRDPQNNILALDDSNVIASGTLNMATTNNVSHAADLYPDHYGSTKSDRADGRFIVSDQMFLTAETSCSFGGTGDLICYVRIHCYSVILEREDWKSIAIQSSMSS